jgi:hypothetical protein
MAIHADHAQMMVHGEDTNGYHKCEFCFRTSFGQRDGGVLKMSTPFGRICAAGGTEGLGPVVSRKTPGIRTKPK